MRDKTPLGLLKRSLDAAGRRLDLYTLITARREYPPESLVGLFYAAHVYRAALDALAVYRKAAVA